MSTCPYRDSDPAGKLCDQPTTHRVTQWVDYARATPNHPSRYVLLGDYCEAHANATKTQQDQHHDEMLALEARGEWHGEEPYRPSAMKHDIVVQRLPA